MAAALPFIAAAFNVVGALSSANAERKAQNFNAAVAERNATVARSSAAADAATQDREARRRIGAARAAYGAAGVQLEGSPLDVVEDSAAQAELDKMNILYKGELQAIGQTDTASLSRSRASSATTAGIFGAARGALAPFSGQFGSAMKVSS